MSKQPVRGVETEPQGEDSIAEFLLAHPDFFERHSSVLARLKLPHQRGSAAISLVERQVLVLREKHAALERKLQELIENGRSNDAIADRLHRLTRRLLRARDLGGVQTALETSLREDFGASRWIIVLTSPGQPRLAELHDQHVGFVARGSAELKIFVTFVENARPRSGQIRDTQREYLFGPDAGAVGSMVMIPLGERAALGLLA